MEVIAALVVLHCQNFLDPIACEERMLNCIRYNYQVVSDMRPTDIDLNPVKEEIILAQAYQYCLENDLSIDVIDNY